MTCLLEGVLFSPCSLPRPPLLKETEHRGTERLFLLPFSLTSATASSNLFRIFFCSLFNLRESASAEFRMGSKKDKLISNLKEENFHIFRDFMTGITKFDELGTAGSKLLLGFQQALEYIRRPPIDSTSKLVNKIIVANETKRVKSYVNYGCRKPNDDVQNVTKLHSCKTGLLNHISKAKVILDELEGLLGNITSAIQSTHGNLLAPSDLVGVELNEQTNYNNSEGMALSHSQNTDVTHLAALMAIIYSMVKQDYSMQERIISSLDLKSSSGELESYCLMWSLHPFINDDIMHQAWKLIP